MMIRVGFEPTRFLTSKLISGEPETSAITTRPSDQSMRSRKAKSIMNQCNIGEKRKAIASTKYGLVK
jgi:hypothetical protein